MRRVFLIPGFLQPQNYDGSRQNNDDCNNNEFFHATMLKLQHVFPQFRDGPMI